MEKFRLQMAARRSVDGNSFAAVLLGGGMDLNVRGTHGREAVLDDVAGEFGLVAITTEMTEENVFEICRNQICEDSGSGIIAEVPMTTHDALLDAPGAAKIVLEEFHVMIGFEDEDVGGTNAFHDELGGVTEIGEETDLTTVGPKHEANRIVSIVRDGESVHADIAEFKGSAGREETKIEFGGFELKFDSFPGEAIAVDGNGELVAERAEAVGVIGMLVSEENAVQRFWSTADLGEALADLFGAKAGIDEEAGIAILKVGAITVGAAAKDGELNRH